MRWTDQAIILSARKLGETGAVVKVFAREQGICAGAARGAYGRTRRGLYQPGNIVHAAWSARVEEQLGKLSCEMETPIAAFVMHDHARLLAMSSALALTELALATHDPHPQLYDHLYYLLQRLRHGLEWQQEYVQLELVILRESGFGLELDSCAATGTCENLIYVSPRSGSAVSAEAGEPYKEKLLPLPSFLRDTGHGVRDTDIAQGLALTGYFLEHRLLEAHHRKMPPARERLAGMLSRPLIQQEKGVTESS